MSISFLLETERCAESGNRCVPPLRARSGVEVVLEHRLEREPSGHLQGVVYFHRFLASQERQGETRERLVQLRTDSAVHYARRQGIALPMRNEAVITKAGGELRIVARIGARRPVIGEVDIESAIASCVRTIDSLVRHEIEQIIDVA